MDTSSNFFPFQYRQEGVVDLDKLLLDTPRPPRYLIRVHSLYSRGCMTENAFISAAEFFAVQRNIAPPRLQDYEPEQFERYTHNHLTNYKGSSEQPFFSPFVSLTTSLRTALGWAKLRSLWKHQDIRIAVLDTSTVTETNCDCDSFCNDPFHQNPIWPANMVYKACHGKTKDYPDEFLAFGHVRGTFKTCTFAELETTILHQYIPELGLLSRDQRYDDLPVALDALWRTEQKLYPYEKNLVIHIARQLSNDDLLIPMVAFVLCVRRRSLHDKHVLDTVVRAARSVEKQATYDFLGTFDAFDVVDYFSKTSGQQVVTADSAELVQTSAILEGVKLCFAAKQEEEAHKMWDCTTVALICKYFCPPRIGNIISRAASHPRHTLSSDLARAFLRLQVAVFKSKFRGLRLLKDALTKFAQGYDILSGLIEPANVRQKNPHELWTQTFGEIATYIENYDGISQHAEIRRAVDSVFDNLQVNSSNELDAAEKVVSTRSVRNSFKEFVPGNQPDTMIQSSDVLSAVNTNAMDKPSLDHEKTSQNAMRV